MQPLVTVIDNKGLFYQKKILLIILGVCVVLTILFLCGLWGYVTYQEQILTVIPWEIIVGFVAIFIFNLVLCLVIFSRYYLVEKNVYKISPAGITQLSYYVNRIFPTQCHIDWSEIACFDVVGKSGNRSLTIGSKFTKFVIQEKFQVECDNFNEALARIEDNLIKNSKKKFAKCQLNQYEN